MPNLDRDKSSNQSFKRTIIVSIILHLGVFALFIVIAANPTTRRASELPHIKGYLVEVAGIKKPQNALPPPKVEPAAPKVEKKAVITKEIKKEAKPKSNAKLEKAKAAALLNIKNEIREEGPKTPRKDNFPQEQKLGTGPEGDEGIIDEAMAIYELKLMGTIKSNWILSNRKAVRDNPDILIRIKVKISPDGDLMGQEILTKSGIQSFDDSCINAIKASDPFPSADPTIAKRVRNASFIFEFYGRDILKLLPEE